MKYFLCFLTMLCFVFSVQAASVYEADISVEAEAENQSLAKDLALKKAYRQGFLQVARRVADSGQLALLESLSDDQLAHFIRETAVVSERGGNKSYRADLKVTVNANLLQQFLNENDATYVAAEQNEVLIVPVLAGEGVASEENVWQKTWLDKGIIASGDVWFKVWGQPVSEKALDYETLKKESGLRAVYVVKFVLKDEKSADITVQYLADGTEYLLEDIVSDGNIYERGIADVVHYITDKRSTKTALSENGQATFVYRYSRLKDWLDAEKKLKDINLIKKVETGGLGGGKVQMVIDYIGTIEGLSHALQEKGLSLEQEAGFYVLKQR